MPTPQFPFTTDDITLSPLRLERMCYSATEGGYLADTVTGIRRPPTPIPKYDIVKKCIIISLAKQGVSVQKV
jgi:hypothetical protein